MMSCLENSHVGRKENIEENQTGASGFPKVGVLIAATAPRPSVTTWMQLEIF